MTAIPGPILWTAVRHRAALGVTLVAAGAVIGLGLSFLFQPQYRAEVILLPQTNQNQQGLLGSLTGQFGGLAGLAGLDIESSASKHEALEVLKSQSLVRDFIADRNLMPVLFADEWDSSGGAWKVDGPEIPTINDAWREFDTNIRGVREDRRTGSVTLGIVWHDPEVAAEWANDLAARANARMRDRAIKDALRSLAYLEKEVESARVVEVKQALYKLIEGQYKTIVFAKANEDFAFKVVDAALAPDEDDYVQPKRAVFAAVGGLLGSLCAAFIVLLDLRRIAPPAG